MFKSLHQFKISTLVQLCGVSSYWSAIEMNTSDRAPNQKGLS